MRSALDPCALCGHGFGSHGAARCTGLSVLDRRGLKMILLTEESRQAAQAEGLRPFRCCCAAFAESPGIAG